MLDLPGHLFALMLRSLSAPELARLGTVSRSIRESIDEAGLWSSLCVRRWPGCARQAIWYGGWRALYCARISNPEQHLFGMYVDACSEATVKAQAISWSSVLQHSKAGSAVHALPLLSEGGALLKSQQQLHRGTAVTRVQEDLGRCFAQVATVLLCLHSRLHAQPELSAAADFSALCADMAWWLCAEPQVVVHYVRSGHRALMDANIRGLTLAQLPDARDRQVVMRCLLNLPLQDSIHESVRSRLQREAHHLGDCIQALSGQEHTWSTLEASQQLMLASLPKTWFLVQEGVVGFSDSFERGIISIA